jgi:ectoine hydroxylase
MTVDPYVTRTAQPERIARGERVLWGAPSDDPEIEARAKSFDRDGFLILRDFLSPEEVAELLAEARRCRLDAPPGAELVYEPQSDRIRSVFRVHELVPAFGRLASHPDLLSFVRRVLGDDVYIHQSRINYKPALGGKVFQWHSDFETWHAEDGMPHMRAVSCVVMLTDNTTHNGPLMLIPGSHRTFVRCVGRTPENHYLTSLRKQELGTPDEESLAALVKAGDIFSATGDPGTVVFFDCNTMHASTANLTPFPRINGFFVYNHCENRLVDPFCGRDPRPDFLATRDPKPLDR